MDSVHICVTFGPFRGRVVNQTHSVSGLRSAITERVLCVRGDELLLLLLPCWEQNITVHCVTVFLDRCQMLFIAQLGSSLTALITLNALTV